MVLIPGNEGSAAFDEETDLPLSGVEIAPGVRVPSDVLRFQFSRGSGPGGQNVNKVNTRAELRIAIGDLVPVLKYGAIQRLRTLAGSRLSKLDELIFVAGAQRSQEQNRQETLARLRELLIAAMHEPKRRRKTKPSRAARERRLDGKRRRSETKAQRKSRE